MRAKVQITVEWELASPDDYPVEGVNSWLEAAAYDIENVLDINFDVDAKIFYGTPELADEPETEPFVRFEDLDGEV